MKPIFRLFAILVGLLISFLSFSQLRTAHIFTDNMVLQRDKPIAIWGWASAGEKITVSLAQQTTSIQADKAGKWVARLASMPADTVGKVLTIRGKNQTITYKNILIGDVWICSGQSNMEWRVSQAANPLEEAQNAHFPYIRHFEIPRDRAFTPKDNILPAGSWKEAIGDSILNFTAVGYYFARNLYHQLKVPIGIINSTWGGTNVETWTSPQSIGIHDEFQAIADTMKKIRTSIDSFEVQLSLLFKKWLYSFYDTVDRGIIEKWYEPNLSIHDWDTMTVPILWEDHKLPNFDGTVWFRKEVELPCQLQGKPLYLRLGFIRDIDVVYWNGKKIGETFHNKTWRSYLIPSEYIDYKGKNTITVRIFNYTDSGGFVEPVPTNMSIDLNRYGNSPLAYPVNGKWLYKVSSEFPAYRRPPTEQKLMAVHQNDYPSMLYNAMIAPITQMSIKGVIWYQGESNAFRSKRYYTLFPNLITDWRKQFNQGDFPFLWVQLANFRAPVAEPAPSTWANIREAQMQALKLPHTGLATAIDIGEANDIHPKNKQEVGRRLALQALRVAYKADTVKANSAIFKGVNFEPNGIRLFFENTYGKLYPKDRYGYLKGFQIAGEDRKFYWASAEVQGETVFVYGNSMVKNPVAVRYAWADNPDDANLYNAVDLPTLPFRTDDWE